MFRKTHIPQLLVQVFMIISLLSCSNDVLYKDIAQINYGTSFGECVGFCKHDVTLKKNKATFRCYSWYPAAQTVTKVDSIRNLTSDSIYSLNTTAFFNLPGTIGCPDCADGGAEWLEIELTNGNKHKVTFEYHHEPTLIKTQIIKLREVLSSNECQ